MRKRLWTRALALGSLGACTALATPPGVQVEVDDACSSVSRAQLTRLLDIEQRRDLEAEVRKARISVVCVGSVVRLRVERQGEVALPRERAFSSTDTAGEIGARVLSLAAIELLKPEPEAASLPEPAPPPPAEPTPPPPLPPRESPASVRLMLVGSAQSFALSHPLVGGGLAVDYLRLGPFGMRLGFDLAVAERSYELGHVRQQLSSLNAQLGYLALHDAWSARAFAGYRLGTGRISGTATDEVNATTGTVSGLFGGPLLSAGLGLRSGSWVAELGAEAGAVSFPLQGRVDGHDAVRFGGYWLSLSLSLGALL